MAPIMEILARWISQSRPELDSDPDEPCALQEIRSSICEIAELYAKRYLDAFPQLPIFVQGIWEMLGGCTLSQKYDTLVSKAVGFLSTVVRMGSSREMFQSTETLEQLCSAIILPNIAIREADEELFEDNQLNTFVVIWKPPWRPTQGGKPPRVLSLSYGVLCSRSHFDRFALHHAVPRTVPC